MKARGTLLMALPNMDQLKFHSYQDAKLLMVAIEKRYGGNKESKKPNSPQLAREDLEQIDPDDLEEMDLHWKMAMLTIRARSFIKRIDRNLDISGQKISFDRSKVECFNCHKNVRFARECRAPKNQENRGREYGRKTVPVENPTENALIAQDGIGGYDWSYQAEEEHPTNYALMELTSSGSSYSLDFERIRRMLSPDQIRDIMQFPLPYTGNHVPPKPDLTFIDEQVESDSVDVLSNVASSDVKTVESKHESVDVKNKGVYSTIETKLVRKNNFSHPIIEDWNSDNESEAEPINTACYVLNRTLVIKPHNKTPYELIRGRPTLIDFMKPFEYPVTILNTRDHLSKFNGKADEGFFCQVLCDWIFDIDTLTISMNYEPVVTEKQTNGIAGTKDNIVVGQAEKKKKPEQEYILIPICITDPLISQGPKDSTVDAGKKATKVDESQVLDNGGQDDLVTKSDTAGPSFANTASPSQINATGIPACTNAFEEHPFERFSPFKNAFSLPHVPIMTPINDTGIFGNTFDDEAVEEKVEMNNVVSSYTIPDALLTKFFKDHPKDQKPVQALKDPNWVEAMQDELLQFKMLKVWTLVDLPKDKWLIDTKWVLKNKKDERVIMVMNKARLVTQGHTQEKGIDYDEVFTPVARIEAIRLFLAYASFKDFVVYQMDVKSAFIYGKIEEEVYVCQPSGFEDLDFLNKVYKVEKALYGLHQAPRVWYETLSTYLMDNGFHKGQIDKALFIKRHKDDILLVQVYVDDIIFGSTKKELSAEFETLMHDKFQMSSMGELSFFLGLQSDGIFISQDKYVAYVLKKFDFSTVKTASTPVEPNKALVNDAKAEDVDVHLYKSMIGSLMYLTASRPDITFVVYACARDSPFNLEAYTDSDYAGASLDRKSTTGGCQFLSKRLILWQCKKQTIVANFTTEAKYVAAANCYGPVLLIQNQMLDYGFNFLNTKIYIDNENKTVYKEWEDRMERAATTASSLEVEQDSVTPTKVSSQEDQPEDQLGVLSVAKILADATRVHTYSRRRRAVSTSRDGVTTASKITSTAEETVSIAGVSMQLILLVWFKKVLLHQEQQEIREIYTEDSRKYLKIIIIGNHNKVYQFFDNMLKVFDRDDLVQLWSLVKERFNLTEPNDDKDRVLWVELKRLFKPDADDELWKLQRYMHDPLK
nr:putative ribonuclease H-like domain-containing protein [Tanacetum cinerariifolium]